MNAKNAQAQTIVELRAESSPQSGEVRPSTAGMAATDDQGSSREIESGTDITMEEWLKQLSAMKVGDTDKLALLIKEIQENPEPLLHITSWYRAGLAGPDAKGDGGAAED